MTVREVKDRVGRIKVAQGDPEVAHSEEDALYSDLLAAIAHGRCIEPARCAEEALKTKRLTFARWCA